MQEKILIQCEDLNTEVSGVLLVQNCVYPTTTGTDQHLVLAISQVFYTEFPIYGMLTDELEKTDLIFWNKDVNSYLINSTAQSNNNFFDILPNFIKAINNMRKWSAVLL